VEIVRKGVEEDLWGHILVEGSIEDGHMGDIGEEFHRHLYPLKVGGVVQRCQRHILPYRFEHGIIYHHRAAETLTAVNDTVTYCGDLTVWEAIADESEGTLMIGKGVEVPHLLAPFFLVPEPS